MSQWKSYANSLGMVEWAAQSLHQGSGKAAIAANNTALLVNSTPGDIVSAGVAQNRAVGVWPVTPYNKANTSGESGKVHGLGWAMRRAGEGPATAIAVANGVFVNGETITLANGSVNGLAVITTNATGNLASAFISISGLFTNSTEANANFNRELHVSNLNVTNAAGGWVGAGDANVIQVTIGNTDISYGVVAVGYFVSNATGGFTNSTTQAITWSGNAAPTANGTGFWGLFANVQANNKVAITFNNAANGLLLTGGGTVTANLAPSTGGHANVTATGGRSGRVTYEMLVISRHLANGTSSVANNVQLPQ